MKTKLVRVEQVEADSREVDQVVNAAIKKLGEKGHIVKDLKIAVGRDADITASLKKRYSITIILLYD